MISRAQDPQWRRASRCGNSTCVEVAYTGDRVLVRDSKNPHVGPLSFTVAEWEAFADAIGNGELRFDDRIPE
jgi:hypothetical protein